MPYSDKDVILDDLACITRLIDKMKAGEALTADEKIAMIRMQNDAEVRELEEWWNAVQ
jgi:hypothetical protein